MTMNVSTVLEENMDTPFPDVKNMTERLTILDLKEINDAEAKILVPVTVFYVIVMVLGLLGNTLVIIVHKLRPTRIFIVCLAALDITACSVGIPYHVLDLMNPYTYIYPIACKILTFLITLPTIASMFMLVIVAVDRYLKLCKPLRNEEIKLESIRTCVIAILCSLVVTWPYILMYGQSSIRAGERNITGSQCFFDDSYSGTPFPTVYTGFTLLIFVIVTLVLIVLYIVIWRAVIKQEKYYNRLVKSADANNRRFDTESIFSFSSCIRSPEIQKAAVESNNGKACVTQQKSDVGLEAIGDDISYSYQKVNKNPPEKVHREDVEEHAESHLCEKNGSMSREDTHRLSAIKVNVHKKASTLRFQLGTTMRSQSQSSDANYNSVRHQNHQPRTKLTKIMFTITFVFIIAYLPTFCISLLNATIDTFWNDMSNFEIILYDTLLRFYLLNNMAKPFIYVVWDSRFRMKCIRLFKILICRSTSSTNEDML
ncbi:hypothetical protein CHS0354_029120 [Potamilus streckersoni]|uniref:G-protein coupled receptors family 1 profile domain-containing protein n=1 Tax=Potamilus streckersoni TaxID=2493646 RepID=A0AAE0W402_9BIVA|nr:hypothetical protein CHS0354_029120 [Potamilus streckersoni]